ncbi:MAG: EamA family transporter [Rhodospirillaceae bacterium]|nr:EamA family transporter [Rhodospirillaceae bacterium]|tara:strand:- start:165 stop:1055 length:891 start_codon:yes stop_codon:yes gene_type:complete
MSSNLKPAHLAALCALVLFWSLAFVMLKIAVATVPPASAAFSRLLVAAVMLWAIMRLMGQRLSWNPTHWRYFLLLGFIANALPFLLVLHGMRHIDSGLGAILMGAMPVVTVVLAHFFSDGSERLTPRKTIGVGIGFAALLLLIGPAALEGLGRHVFAELSVIGGAICFAVAAVVTRRAPELPICTLSAGVMITATLCALPIALISDWPFSISPDPKALWALLWLGIFPTGLATLLYFFVVLGAGTGFFAMSNYLVPVAGVFWGVLFLSEQPDWQSLAALAMILAGIWLVGPAQAKR